MAVLALWTPGNPSLGEVEGSGSGTLKLEFVLKGEAADATLVARDFPDGGHFLVAVTADGRALISQETDGDEHQFQTEAGFFVPGDEVRVTYSWDSEVGGSFCVENLTTGALHAEPVPGTVSMGLDEDAPWIVGNEDGDEDEFDVDIAYVALWDRVEPPGPLDEDAAGRLQTEVAGGETDALSDGGNTLAEGAGEAGVGTYGEAPGVVTLTFELSTAAFQNTLGYYLVDPDTGEIAEVALAFEDARSEFGGGDLIPGASDSSFEVPPGAQVGVFLIANGGALNDYAALGEGTLKFVNAEGGPATLLDEAPQLVHVALDGAETVLQGNIWHSAAYGDRVGLNSDGAVHIQGIAGNDDGTWTFGFEDLASPDWDGDFTDVVFTVDTGGSGVAFLNPDFDTSATPLEDDFFSEEDDDEAEERQTGDEGEDDGDGDQPAEDDPDDKEEDELPGDDEGDEAGGTGSVIVLGDGDDTVIGGPGDTILGSSGQDTLILDGQKDNILNIHFTSSTENEDGTFSSDGTVSFKDGSPDLIFEDIEKIVPCFTPGTLIETDEGRVPVEELLPGDRVLTRDRGYRPLEWVGHKEVTAELLAARPEFTPVRIARGSLGDGLPEQDMLVSPQHRMLVTGPRAELLFGAHEVLVPAKHMIGVKGITRAHGQLVTYIHIMCDRHEVVRADGAWSESFQPGDLSLAGLDEDQRRELLALFPELASPVGQRAYAAARMSLKAHEARALLAG